MGKVVVVSAEVTGGSGGGVEVRMACRRLWWVRWMWRRGQGSRGVDDDLGGGYGRKGGRILGGGAGIVRGGDEGDMCV
ncbi:hypothetical protein Tco_0306076 [Tanacetum coccineum]